MNETLEIFYQGVSLDLCRFSQFASCVPSLVQGLSYVMLPAHVTISSGDSGGMPFSVHGNG